MKNNEKKILRTILHEELDKIINEYFKIQNPKKFQKMMLQFGDMKVSDLKNQLETFTIMFQVGIDPVKLDNLTLIDNLVKDKHPTLFNRSPINRMENKMTIQKQ